MPQPKVMSGPASALSRRRLRRPRPWGSSPGPPRGPQPKRACHKIRHSGLLALAVDSHPPVTRLDQDLSMDATSGRQASRESVHHGRGGVAPCKTEPLIAFHFVLPSPGGPCATPASADNGEQTEVRRGSCFLFFFRRNYGPRTFSVETALTCACGHRPHLKELRATQSSPSGGS